MGKVKGSWNVEQVGEGQVVTGGEGNTDGFLGYWRGRFGPLTKKRI